MTATNIVKYERLDEEKDTIGPEEGNEQSNIDISLLQTGNAANIPNKCDRGTKVVLILGVISALGVVLIYVLALMTYKPLDESDSFNNQSNDQNNYKNENEKIFNLDNGKLAFGSCR